MASVSLEAARCQPHSTDAGARELRAECSKPVDQSSCHFENDSQRAGFLVPRALT